MSDLEKSLFIVTIDGLERQFMEYLPSVAVRKTMIDLEKDEAKEVKVVRATGGTIYYYSDVNLYNNSLTVNYSSRRMTTQDGKEIPE